MNSRAEFILDFWFNQTSQEKRFKRNNSFDQEIRDKFFKDYELAKNNEYDSWQDNPKECLALIILLDQFSRNLFRDNKQAFDLDLKARLNEIYQAHTGKPLKEIEKALERDNFMKPNDAKDFGLIDHVVDKREIKDK